jgi:uncharacterized membrane protein (DUF4010 family)
MVDGSVEVLVRFLVALGLGALVGLEREYAQAKVHKQGYGGIRTFPLIALLGALVGFLDSQYSLWIVIVAFIAVVLLILISHYFVAMKTAKVGITSEMAGLITFFIGVLCSRGEYIIAVPLAVVMTLLLYERIELHWFAAHLKREELHSTIKFAIIALVILPLIPDIAYGPFDFFNPRTIWMMVVLVSGISFVGYILIKLLGKRGMELAGFLGGFVSSTATTLSLIERGEKTRSGPVALIGIVAANAAMLTKVLILIFIVNRAVFTEVAVPFVMMMLGSAVIAGLLSIRHPIKTQELEIRSPFALRPALTFALIFGMILFVVKAATFYFSQQGVFVVTFFSGLIDADATVLSTLQIAKNGLLSVASKAAVLAVVANTMTKGILILALGKKQFGLHAAGVFCLIAAVGAIGLFL